MTDEIMTLKVAQNALREMLFYAEHCGMSGAMTSRQKAERAIKMIQDRLDLLEGDK